MQTEEEKVDFERTQKFNKFNKPSTVSIEENNTLLWAKQILNKAQS
jgi:ATP-dependent RNA helicase DeaD